MEYLGQVNNRDILYLTSINGLNTIRDILDNWNWLLVAIADNKQEFLLNGLARECLDHKVLYVCGLGEAGSKIDLEFDLEIVNRKIETNSEDYSDTPVTISHESFDEGFWFATTSACHDYVTIEKVVCINLTNKEYKSLIAVLIKNINEGWLPE